MNFDPETWRCVRAAATRGELREPGLVLASVGIEHRIESVGDGWGLWVTGADEARALLQLEKFANENRSYRAEKQVPVRVIDSGWRGVGGYLAVIWLLPLLQGSFPGVDWYRAGAMQAGSVVDGEWWRVFTALTLHGDMAHIAANSLFGAVFGLFVGRYLGSGFGWLVVLLAAGLGNWGNAYMQSAQFSAIGASTATFAALGLVAAFVWRRGYLRSGNWRRSFAPMFAAIAMLAFTGTGGENTDVAGHFMGFLCGLGAGLLLAPLDPARLGKSGQFLGAAIALGLLASSWSLAL